MKLINKKNFIHYVCLFYTIISILIIITEMISGKTVQTHHNILMCLLLTVMAVFILSMQSFFSEYSPLLVLLVQLVVGTLLVILITYINGLYSELHPDAYKDMIRSYLMFFIPGAGYYYWHLRREVKMQNEAIQVIQQLKEVGK